MSLLKPLSRQELVTIGGNLPLADWKNKNMFFMPVDLWAATFTVANTWKPEDMLYMKVA